MTRTSETDEGCRDAVRPRWLQAADAILIEVGKEIAGIWITVVGFILLLGFPVAGLAASIALGVAAAWIIGGSTGKTGIWAFVFGTGTVIAFVLVTFLFGLFLRRYVWPYVKDRVFRAVDELTDRAR